MKRKMFTVMSFATMLFVILTLVISFGTESAGMQNLKDHESRDHQSMAPCDDSIRSFVWERAAAADRCTCRMNYHLWPTPCPVD